MIKWLYMQNETYIEGFDFKKLKKIDDVGESVISQTLASEYNRMTSAMRKVSPIELQRFTIKVVQADTDFRFDCYKQWTKGW